MAAPLPMRFYNPIKELCVKSNLDYETVVGLGFSPKMREAIIAADIQKPLDEIKSEDKKRIKHKKEFMDRKYGGSPQSGVGEGETEDKGRNRYDLGLIVEPVCSESGEMDKSETVSSGVGNGKLAPGEVRYTPGTSAKPIKWIPGKGISA